MKDKVTLTIEQNLLSKIDSMIDKKTIKSRSHAVEHLLYIGLDTVNKDKNKVGVLIAKKKNKVTDGPKLHCMIEVNKKPILEYNIQMFKKYNVNDLIIFLDEDGAEISDYFGTGVDLGVNITYIKDKPGIMSAGTLLKLKKKINETFIVSNAHDLKGIDLNEMWNFHLSNQSIATMGLTSTDDPERYGTVKLKGIKIKEFCSKNTAIASNLVSSGIYIFEPEMLDIIENEKQSLEGDIFPELAKSLAINGYMSDSYWYNIKAKKQIKIVEKEL